MKNTASLKEQLVNTIDVTDYIREKINKEWSGKEEDLLSCPLANKRHDPPDDSTPSLSLDPNSGKFNCFGCGWKGTSIVGFHTDVFCNGNFSKALAQLFQKYVRPTISNKEVIELHKTLLRRHSLVNKISARRGWNKKTIKNLKIGWDGLKKRTSIPYFNLQGLCIDIRYHDTLNKATTHQKFSVIGRPGSRNGDFFPLNPNYNPFSSDYHEIWIVEGESDAILAYQDGLNAVTVSGGAGVWSSIDHQKLKGFKGKEVIICMDNDKAGQKAAETIATSLAAVEITSLKNIVVPQGNDISDYFLKYGGSADQLKQIAALEEYTIRPQKRNIQTMPLSETSKSEHIGKHVKTDVLINAKHHTPLSIPRRLEFTCHKEGLCSACPCVDDGRAEYHVLPDDPDLLEWLYTKDFTKIIKESMNLPPRCPMKYTVKEWQNLEHLTMIPALSDRRSHDESQYVVRQGYYIGHGLESNQTYKISAMPVVHPRNKESVLLINKTEGSYDSINRFKLRDDEVSRLKDLFDDDPKSIIKEISNYLGYNVTNIYRRWDVHAAVDLTFHSPKDFAFGGVQLPKGSLEILLFGDTRCGKGQVAEGLVNFYDLGEVVSGENSSFMGLCGGASKIGDTFQLSWGAIPLNHGRLVVIDEFSGLDNSILGKLSRVRSEGIAEINKGGINSKTSANSRLIWIANPRKGKDIQDFRDGVSAIMDLIQTNEDVARFDLAVVVAKGEVDVREINRLHTKTKKTRFTQDDLRKVVLWAWSRKSDHVMFTRDATEYVLDAANELSNIYSADIPLIQGENARFKIAKVAAAVAARCFSTPDGRLLKVTKRHAEVAVQFIKHLYNKNTMGYRQHSVLESSTSKLVHRDQLDEFFAQWDKDTRKILIDGLLSTETFSVREMQDWCDVDGNIAKKFVGTFVRCLAIRQARAGLYQKRPSFIKYLKKLRKKNKK